MKAGIHKGVVHINCIICDAQQSFDKRDYLHYKHIRGSYTHICSKCGSTYAVEVDSQDHIVWFSPLNIKRIIQEIK